MTVLNFIVNYLFEFAEGFSNEYRQELVSIVDETCSKYLTSGNYVAGSKLLKVMQKSQQNLPINLS